MSSNKGERSDSTTILIPGATGVGKTTLALAISCAYPSLVLRSSDVREALRTVAAPEAMPELFHSSYRVLEHSTEEALEILFMRQCGPINHAISRILRRHQSSKYFCVVEGVHLLPTICDSIADRDLLVLLQRQPSPGEHLSRLRDRESHDPFRPASRYAPHIENIRRIGEYIEQSWLAARLPEGSFHAVRDYEDGLRVVRERLVRGT